jgi:hypothetical protein
MCGVTGAVLASVYKGADFERDLCSCCRIVAYNHRHEGFQWRSRFRVSPEANEAAAALAAMAQATIERREARAVRPVPAARRDSTWAAHSCPE